MYITDLQMVETILASFFTIAGAILAIYFVAQYILNALAYWKLAKVEHLPHPGVAWIPFVQIYFLGKACDGYNKQEGKHSARGMIMAILSLCILLFGIASTIMMFTPVTTFLYYLGDVAMMDSSAFYTFMQSLLLNTLGDFLIGVVIAVIGIALCIWQIVLMGMSWNQVFGRYAKRGKVAYLVLSVVSTVFLGFSALGSIFMLATVKAPKENMTIEEGPSDETTGNQ